ANATRNTASVLINGGSGAFPTVVTVNVGLAPAAVAVGDFNGDGRPDFAIANPNTTTISVVLNTSAPPPVPPPRPGGAVGGAMPPPAPPPRSRPLVPGMPAPAPPHR
ncbi:MAG: VCBS repeat-containing protein, partial [Chloroflexota bacterium]|nr:VCBS repeat-containing protein [Chloroflexota bacterium]